MYNNMMSGRGASSTQQEHIRGKFNSFKRKKIEQSLRKLNGQIGEKLVDKRMTLGMESDDSSRILSKKRKFGRENRNFEVLASDDADKELDLDISLPAVVLQQPLNMKREDLSFTSEFFCSSQPTSTQRLDRKNASTTNCSTVRRDCVGKSVCFSNQNEMEPWMKRKFYIVGNAGVPTEIYCTDLIHRVRQGMSSGCRKVSTSTIDGHSPLLKIVDKWREEWSTNGVQVPLGSTLEQYSFEDNDLFPDMPQETKLFQPPKKCISLYPSKYTDIHSKEMQHLRRESLCYYLLDELDERWLNEEFSNGKSISEQTFVQVMNQIEIIVYRKIHDALLEPARVRSSSEEDAECMICRLPEWDIGDNIVFCDGCNISVHQSCYGISALPVNEWFCRVCECFGSPPQATNGRPLPQCLFCPVKGGPMKAMKHLENWAHVACALWIPEIRFGDADLREPITHVNEIPPSRWQARCCVCDTRNGACIQCVHPKCTQNASKSFHVGCAQQSDFVLNIENDERSESGVRMVALCDKHSASSPQKDRKIRFNKNRLPEMHRKFFSFIEPSAVAKSLGVPLDVVQRVHSYWIKKRNQRGCKPLIAEPDVRDTLTPEDSRNAQKLKAQWRGLRPQHTPSTSSFAAFHALSGQEVQRNYEALRLMRLDYEKARNLCYMVTKREKLKKIALEYFEEQVDRAASNIFCTHPVVPISKRQIDKLLIEWRTAVES